MKKILFFGVALIAISFQTSAQQSQKPPEYKVVTVIESIVPGGIGRSRMIENNTTANTEDFTTERENGKSKGQGDIKRRDIKNKADEFSETKLVNFFSLTGINFQNIAANDAVIASKMNELAKEGWKLTFVTSGVESNAGTQDGEGIFITRLVFSR